MKIPNTPRSRAVRLFGDDDIAFISQALATGMTLRLVMDVLRFYGTQQAFFASVEASGPHRITRALVPCETKADLMRPMPRFGPKELAEIQELAWDMRLSLQSLTDVMNERHHYPWMISRYKFIHALRRSGYELRHAVVPKEENT